MFISRVKVAGGFGLVEPWVGAQPAPPPRSILCHLLKEAGTGFCCRWRLASLVIFLNIHLEIRMHSLRSVELL